METVQLKNITLINDDCMNVLRELPDQAFDLAIVDPPYFTGPNRRKFYGGEFGFNNVRRTLYTPIEKWEKPKNEYFDELRRVSKQQIVWGCNYYPQYLGPGRIVWDKCNGGTTFSDCEIAYCSLHYSVRQFRYMWNGMMQGKSVSEGHIMQGNKKLNEKRIHQTQKPVALYKWLLATYAKQGDRILDTHLGSGSIAIACQDAGLDLMGIELDEKVYRSAVDRIRTHQQQMKLAL